MGFFSSTLFPRKITTQAAANPSALSYSLLSKKRDLKLMDESFVHYSSNYNTSIADLTNKAGGAISIIGGKLSFPSGGIYATAISPKVNWYAIELVIDSMSSAGTTQQLGMGIYKDASNHVYATYNKVTNQYKILVNGTAIMTKTRVTNTTNLKLTLVLHKYAYALYAQEGIGLPIFIGQINNYTVDFGLLNSIQTYKYCIYSAGDAAATHSITSLRAGAPGGFSIFNQRLVRHSDGQPYIRGDKYLFTGDWSSLDGIIGQSYRSSTQCLFSLDINTYDVVCLGHMYVQRTGSDSIVRNHGGQDMKLTWYANRNQWLWTTVLCDDYNINQPPNTDDPYVWLEYGEAFGEVIINESRFNVFGINQSTTKMCYDMSQVLFYDGQYHVLAGETNVNRFTNVYWTNVNPIHLSGTDLSNLTFVRHVTATFYECGTWAFMNNTVYIFYATFGSKNVTVFNSNLGVVGNLNYSNATDSAQIPAMDLLVRKNNGVNEYLIFGFDCENLTLVDVDGVSANYSWTVGNTVLYKANETSIGGEF